jgi:hypothetical protein
MALINDASNLINSLYAKGATNNEELQKLLVILKDISDSRPDELREEFKSIFSELNLTEETLNDTSAMTMMLLTKLAMSYKPTNSSAFPRRVLEIQFDNMLFMEELNLTLSQLLDKGAVELLSNEKTKSDLFDTLTSLASAVRSSAGGIFAETQRKVDFWLKEIRY